MSNEEERKLCSRNELASVENPKGIHRTTLAFNKETMLCHFVMKKGAVIPLHNHEAVQNGYVFSGKVQFRNSGGDLFLAESGSGYTFAGSEEHGAEVIEDAEVVECFAPMRPEYADNLE